MITLVAFNRLEKKNPHQAILHTGLLIQKTGSKWMCDLCKAAFQSNAQQQGGNIGTVQINITWQMTRLRKKSEGNHHRKSNVANILPLNTDLKTSLQSTWHEKTFEDTLICTSLFRITAEDILCDCYMGTSLSVSLSVCVSSKESIEERPCCTSCFGFGLFVLLNCALIMHEQQGGC